MGAVTGVSGVVRGVSIDDSSGSPVERVAAGREVEREDALIEVLETDRAVAVPKARKMAAQTSSSHQHRIGTDSQVQKGTRRHHPAPMHLCGCPRGASSNRPKRDGESGLPVFSVMSITGRLKPATNRDCNRSVRGTTTSPQKRSKRGPKRAKIAAAQRVLDALVRCHEVVVVAHRARVAVRVLLAAADPADLAAVTVELPLVLVIIPVTGRENNINSKYKEAITGTIKKEILSKKIDQRDNLHSAPPKRGTEAARCGEFHRADHGMSEGKPEEPRSN